VRWPIISSMCSAESGGSWQASCAVAASKAPAECRLRPMALLAHSPNPAACPQLLAEADIRPLDGNSRFDPKPT
jgi:hypothetical protein